MPQKLQASVREHAMSEVWRSRFARIVEGGLWAIIANVVRRPYRAQSMRAANPEPVVPAVAEALLRAEIAALPAARRLVDNGRFQVYCATADEIPWTLQEIGRLRELAFREVSEGTGRCSDIDMFDSYYRQLFVWDSEANAVVGGYRMGLLDEILERYGKRGLYTQSLFKYAPRVLDSMNPALELGRSFIRPEYQRDYAPLLLLWRGIARFVARSPKYAVLFGAVSISSSYALSSRRLMVEFLSANNAETRLARYIKPRRPFRGGQRNASPDTKQHGILDIDDLSRAIAQAEHDHKGIPVLLRQYLRLGGRLLGFSFDRNFADALDGLMMVDLRLTAWPVLARYMGAADAAAFLEYHRLQAAKPESVISHLTSGRRLARKRPDALSRLP
jgi:GNAT acetyltransferase-like protein